MHPYFDNLDDYFYFTYRNEVIEIEFYDYISIKDREKVKNFFKLFNLEKRYNKYAKKKLIKLKEEIRRNVIKQIKGVETISINEIQSKIKEELYDSYINISKYKKKDALTKLKLDYLKQMKKEDLSDLSMYIASENGENFLKIEDSFWV